MVDAVSIVAPTLREAVNIPVLASRVHGALSRRGIDAPARCVRAGRPGHRHHEQTSHLMNVTASGAGPDEKTRERPRVRILYLSVAGPGGLVKSRPELHTELGMATRRCSWNPLGNKAVIRSWRSSHRTPRHGATPPTNESLPSAIAERTRPAMGSRIGSEFLRAKRLHRGRLCLEPDPGSRCRLRIATSPCAGGSDRRTVHFRRSGSARTRRDPVYQVGVTEERAARVPSPRSGPSPARNAAVLNRFRQASKLHYVLLDRRTGASTGQQRRDSLGI